MNTKLYLVFFIFLGLISLIGIFWSIRTEKRLKRFFAGKKGRDVEEKVISLENEIKSLKEAKNNLEQELVVVNKKLRKSIRGLETVRFNPFPDQGSNQSFAVGILNEDGDGVVFSSLYSRERMSVFAKPIKSGKSEYELSDEERKVLEKAKVS